MPPEPEDRIARFLSSSGDELNSLVHETDEEALLAMLENPNLERAHVTSLLDRLDLPANVLIAVAKKENWTSIEGVRLRLARHPRTPKRIALATVRQLHLFDLVRLSLLRSAPPDVRRIAEEVILSRAPHLPVGEKLTLARRGPSRVAGSLLAEGHPRAIKLALENAFLAEGQVLKVLAKAGVPERVVVAIAEHPKWSRRSNVRMALVRNPHTPVPAVLAFLPDLGLCDLKEIAMLDGLAPHLRNCIQQERTRRGGAAQDRAR
jgi:hypothetical protein